MPPRSRSAASQKAVAEIREGLRRLTRGFRMLAREGARAAARAEDSRRTRVSPGRRRHGRYIGLIRNLPARQKAQVRAVRAKKGVDAAIAMATKLRRSR
jgi:hypothetical protein